MRKPIVTAILAALAGTGGLLASVGPAASTAQAAGSVAAAASHVLHFTNHPIDTSQPMRAPSGYSLASHSGSGLQVVQFSGPIQQSWLDKLSSRGIVPVHYVADYGYIVWTDAAARAQLDALRSRSSWLVFSTPLHSFLKMDPRLDARLKDRAAGDEEVDIVVQIYHHAGSNDTRRFVESKAVLNPVMLGPVGPGKVSAPVSRVLAYENVYVRVRVSDLLEIAELPDVTFVGERLERRMLDEKQDIIMTGDLTPGPASIDYLQFLISLGFSQNADDYPIVDITDSAVHEGGSGVTVLNTQDPMLRVGGTMSGASRVVAFTNCSTLADTSVGAVDGHGALNAGVVAGYDQRTGSPYQDADGHQLGLGINPFGRVGSTAIFVPSYNIDGCGGTDQGVILSNWQSGAKISTNSWGSTFPPSTYDDSDQAYDVGTRDADPGTAGNQELIYIFAAANSGPSAATVSSPGAGKNVLTVGASENVRGGWTDGCGVGTSGADNANDIIDFSSRGPAPGQRAKPEVVGPGTHIQAGASIYSGYNGNGVCDQYHPAGQTVFAASSGTSHSTPAVAGIASLAYWWIEEGGAGAAAGTVDMIDGVTAPTPALMKAWMMAHPIYLTGVSANDTLPSNNQGYGMPNIKEMFDATPKVLVNQTEVFDNTGESVTYTWGVVDPAKPVRIALAYTDAPGALGTSPQVNNLDLTVEVNGQTYLGNVFDHQWSTTGGSADTKNNYEAVFLPAGTTGDLTITVTATNIGGDGIPGVGDGTDQDFGLVCSNCSQEPTFTVSPEERIAEMCSGEDFSTPVAIGSIQGYTTPVSLSLANEPAGSTATVSPNSVTPPGSTTVSVTDTAGVAAGAYTMTLTGTSGAITKSANFEFLFADAIPAVPTQLTPADGAANVTLTPTLTWDAVPQASSYLVEIATDAGFTNVIASNTTSDTAWTVAPELPSNTELFWRVTARNACGDSLPSGSSDRIFGDGFDGVPLPPISDAFSFVTEALPGDCSIGTTQQVIWSDDMESGAGAWTHSGTNDSWTLGSAAHGGSAAWQANNFSAVSDQRLVSPPVVLPSDLTGLTLSFWNQQSMEDRSGGCFDGSILEISTDGGSTWTQITSGLLTDPYDGPVSTGYSNPLGGLNAWCGDPQAYLNSIVDLDDYAGQTVQFRFRMANDSSVASGSPAWAIDDVKVAGCAAE